jgi:hypothetical protein
MDHIYIPDINNTLDIESELGSEDMEINFAVFVSFYVGQWILLFPTLYVNILVLRMLKRDDLSISLELRIDSICNIIVSVFGLAHHGILKFAFPASENVGIWYCHLSSVFMAIGMFRQMIHSFTLSVYRYVFIMYSQHIPNDKRHNQVVWSIFAIKWLALCIFATKFVIFNKDEFVLFWTTVCNGNYKSIQPRSETNVNSVEYLMERNFYRMTKDDDRALITIFGNVEGHFVFPLQALCVILDIIFYATCLNLLEGYLYLRISKFKES